MQLEINNSFIRVQKGNYTLEVHSGGNVYVMDNIDVVSLKLNDLKEMLNAIEVARTVKEGVSL